MVHIETLIQNRKGEQVELALGSIVKAFTEQGPHGACINGLKASKVCFRSQPICQARECR